jgi:hypothetical protein
MRSGVATTNHIQQTHYECVTPLPNSVLGCRGCLGKMLALDHGLPRLFARFERHVARSEADASLLEEGIGRRTTGKYPDKIIGNLLHLAGNVDDHGPKSL